MPEEWWKRVSGNGGSSSTVGSGGGSSMVWKWWRFERGQWRKVWQRRIECNLDDARRLHSVGWRIQPTGQILPSDMRNNYELLFPLYSMCVILLVAGRGWSYFGISAPGSVLIDAKTRNELSI